MVIFIGSGVRIWISSGSSGRLVFIQVIIFLGKLFWNLIESEFSGETEHIYKVSTKILFYDRINTTVAYKHPCIIKCSRLFATMIICITLVVMFLMPG